MLCDAVGHIEWRYRTAIVDRAYGLWLWFLDGSRELGVSGSQLALGAVHCLGLHVRLKGCEMRPCRYTCTHTCTPLDRYQYSSTGSICLST